MWMVLTRIAIADGEPASQALQPPTPPSAKTECPNGNWTVRLTSLTYTNVVLHIQQPPGTDVLTFSFGTIDP